MHVVDANSEVTRAIEGNVVRYKWQDGVNLAHAVWIFGSPWWEEFARHDAARWDHWVVSVIVGVVALISLPRARLWKEAVMIAAGGWLFLSPWLLGFASTPDARWNAWMLGALVAYVASWAFTDLMRLSHPPLR
jgi:hypothetical protein